MQTTLTTCSSCCRSGFISVIVGRTKENEKERVDFNGIQKWWAKKESKSLIVNKEIETKKRLQLKRD